MIRLFHVYFAGRTVLLAMSELMLLALASVAAAFAVLGSDAGTVFLDANELLKLPLVVGVCMALMHYFDLYDSMILFNPGQAAVRVIQVLGSACVILAGLYHVYPVIQINQNLLMTWVVLAGISLIVWRKVFLAFNRMASQPQRTILFGAGRLAAELADEIESRPELGLDLAGYVDAEPVSSGPLYSLEHLGAPAELEALLGLRKIQRVLVTTDAQRGRPPVEPIQAAKARGVIVDDGPEFYEAVSGRVDLNSLRPSMLLFYEGFRFRPLVRLYKRAASLLLSSIGLVFALPVMAAIAIAIRHDSPGPVIFRQRRTGKSGKPFTLYKFRSMYHGADDGGQSRPAQINDRRCTRVGRWLRRTRLDELPQLVNIFLGDMHFIGPRPFAVDEEEHLSREIPLYSNRWVVRPGATGWAQVRSGYNETIEDNVKKLSYDLYYIKHLSVGLDLLILLESLKILLLGRGAR
jgi:exopolysaccharide biosynthesis polyprenyl glycosylphosphotransferase